LSYIRILYKIFELDILAIPGRDMALVGIVFLLLIGITPINPYLLNTLVFASIFAVFAASWDLLYFTGQLNLGHGAFFGIGAYVSAVLSSRLGLPVSVTIPLGALGGIIIGLIICLPALRLRGPYLAIVTLAVPPILKGIVFVFPELTGGELGIFGLPSISDSPIFTYYFCLAVMLISVSIMWKLTDTKSRILRTGIIFCAIREDEISARTSGINTVKYKVLAFVVSGFFGGIAGGLYAHTMKVVGTSTLDFLFSVYPLIWSIFGGAGTIYGSVVGTYILYFFSSQLLIYVPEVRMVIFTAIIVIMILFMPEGISQWIRGKFEISCPRCKIANSAVRKFCRICDAPLH